MGHASHVTIQDVSAEQGRVLPVSRRRNAILYAHLSKFPLFLPAQSVNQRYWRGGAHS